VGQRGFWDEQQRVTKLQDNKPVLKRLADSIPWESFRPLLDQGHAQERKSNAGRKWIDPLIDASLVPVPNNAIPARRTKKSKPGGYLRTGMKTQTACSEEI
jgi:hypothetical protein